MRHTYTKQWTSEEIDSDTVKVDDLVSNAVLDWKDGMNWEDIITFNSGEVSGLGTILRASTGMEDSQPSFNMSYQTEPQDFGEVWSSLTEFGSSEVYVSIAQTEEKDWLPEDASPSVNAKVGLYLDLNEGTYDVFEWGGDRSEEASLPLTEDAKEDFSEDPVQQHGREFLENLGIETSIEDGRVYFPERGDFNVYELKPILGNQSDGEWDLSMKSGLKGRNGHGRYPEDRTAFSYDESGEETLGIYVRETFDAGGERFHVPDDRFEDAEEVTGTPDEVDLSYIQTSHNPNIL